MSGGDLAAIRHTIEVGFSPVPRGVKANWHPKVAGPAQNQAKQKADTAGSKCAYPCFTRIPVMNVAE